MSFWKRLKNIGSKVGPGIVTGASDDDPSGILTYLQSGFAFGFRTLWLALVNLPFMISIQEMSARLGYATDKGLARLIKEHFRPGILRFVATTSIIVIVVNIGADLLAVGTVLRELVGWPVAVWLFITAGVILLFTISLSYPKFAAVLKWLTLSLLFYVAVAFVIHIDWLTALKATVWPQIAWNKDFVELMAAFFGTTVSPYLFFWQASEEVEDREESSRERKLKRFLVTKNELKHLRRDTAVGMIFSEVTTWFIVVSAAGLFFAHGPTQILSFAQASEVLRPLLGPLAFVAFALGIVGTGLLAVPVLAGSVGYILSEMFGWAEGMNKTWREARSFYLVIVAATAVGLALNLFGFDPVRLLIATAVLYTIITPPLVWVIIKLANKKEVLGDRTNTPWANFWAYLTLLFSIFVAAAYLIVTFL
ncbi:Nramp family divalent metal transporter [Patescibacteria group bacterium]|nr:Nramp family divalent metal transporter [Patescibacteria group bacterium]